MNKGWFNRHPNWTNLIIGVVASLIVFPLGYYVGELSQEQTNNKLNHIDCSVAQVLASDYTSKGQSVNVINNTDGTCSLQFNAGIAINESQSVCFQAAITRANGSVTTYGSCSTTSTSTTTSTTTSSTTTK